MGWISAFTQTRTNEQVIGTVDFRFVKLFCFMLFLMRLNFSMINVLQGPLPTLAHDRSPGAIDHRLHQDDRN
jgi:hypothetical protein